MSESTYTFQFILDASQAEAQARDFVDMIRNELENVDLQIGGRQGGDNTLQQTERALDSLEDRLEQLKRVDVTRGIEELNQELWAAEKSLQSLNALLSAGQWSNMSQHTREWMQTLEQYWQRVEATFGKTEANIARVHGRIFSLGDIQKEFPQDVSPPSDWTQPSQRAFRELKEKHDFSNEELEQNLRLEVEMYEEQIRAHNTRQALVDKMTQLYSQQKLSSDQQGQLGELMGAQMEAEESYESAIQNWIDTQRRLAALANQNEEKAAAVERRAAVQAGDFAAAAGGPVSRVQLTTTANSAKYTGEMAENYGKAATNMARLADETERLNNQQALQNEIALDLIRQKARAEQLARAEAELEIQTGRKEVELERQIAEQLRIQAREQTKLNTEARTAEKQAAAGLEQARASTQDAKAAAAERINLAKAEANERTEAAKLARLRATEEERRLTAEVKAEIRERQAAQRSMLGAGGMGAGVNWRGVGYAAAGALGVYGVDQIGRQAYEAGSLGATQLQLITTFEQLAERAGVAGDEMVAAVQRASAQTIPALNAIGYSNQVLAQRFAAGSEDIIGETELLIEASRRLSQVYLDEYSQPQSIESIFDRLIKYVREGNKEVVDQFQISNQAIADILDVPNEGLRGTEGTVLRWQGMIAILEKELERLGRAQATVAEDMQRSEARITDAMDRIRQTLAEPVAFAADSFAGMVEILAREVEGLDLVIRRAFNKDTLYEWERALDSAIQDFEKYKEQRPFQADEMDEAIDQLQLVKTAIDQVNKAGEGAKFLELDETVDIAKEYAETLKDVSEAALSGPLNDANLSKLREVQEFWNTIGKAAYDASIEARTASSQLQDAGDMAARLQEAIESGDLQAYADEMRGVEDAAFALSGQLEQGIAIQQVLNDLELLGLMEEAGAAGADAMRAALLDLISVIIATGQVSNEQIAALSAFTSELEAAAAAAGIMIGMDFRASAGTAPRSGRELLDSFDSLRDAVNKNSIEERREAERVAKEAERAAEQRQRSALQESRRQAQEQIRAFDNAISRIPGLSSLSPVTEEQMARAKAGLPNEFADNYIRRLRDEIENGKDWPGVSIGEAAGAVGLDGGLPPGVILNEFERQWQSGELWSNPENLKFLDFEAIKADYERQQRAEEGQKAMRQAVANALGIPLEELERQANAGDPIRSAAQDAGDAVDDAGVTLVTALDNISNQLGGINFPGFLAYAEEMTGTTATGGGPPVFAYPRANYTGPTYPPGESPPFGSGRLPGDPASVTGVTYGPAGLPLLGMISPGSGTSDPNAYMLPAREGVQRTQWGRVQPGPIPLTSSTVMPGSSTVPIGPVIPPLTGMIDPGTGPVDSGAYMIPDTGEPPTDLQRYTPVPPDIQASTPMPGSSTVPIGPIMPPLSAPRWFVFRPGGRGVQNASLDPGTGPVDSGAYAIPDRGGPPTNLQRYTPVPPDIQASTITAGSGTVPIGSVIPPLTGMIDPGTGPVDSGAYVIPDRGGPPTNLQRYTPVPPSIQASTPTVGSGTVPIGPVMPPLGVPNWRGGGTAGYRQFLPFIGAAGPQIDYGTYAIPDIGEPATNLQRLTPQLPSIQYSSPSSGGSTVPIGPVLPPIQQSQEQIDESLGEVPEAMSSRMLERMGDGLSSATVVAPIATAWGDDFETNKAELDTVAEDLANYVVDKVETKIGSSGGIVGAVIAGVLEALANAGAEESTV